MTLAEPQEAKSRSNSTCRAEYCDGSDQEKLQIEIHPAESIGFLGRVEVRKLAFGDLYDIAMDLTISLSDGLLTGGPGSEQLRGFRRASLDSGRLDCHG